jgi:hypothetical protein
VQNLAFDFLPLLASSLNGDWPFLVTFIENWVRFNSTMFHQSEIPSVKICTISLVNIFMNLYQCASLRLLRVLSMDKTNDFWQYLFVIKLDIFPV